MKEFTFNNIKFKTNCNCKNTWVYKDGCGYFCAICYNVLIKRGSNE